MIHTSPYGEVTLWPPLIPYGLSVCEGVMEQWKPVVGYKGWYEVSDLGRIKRIKAGARNTKAGRILRLSANSKGYILVHLSRLGCRKTFRVHRLMLMAFVGLPKPGQESNHKNGIKADNHLDNLEWLTSSENELHKFRILGLSNKGEQQGQSKLKNQNIPVIRQLLAERKLTQAAIGGMFNISPSVIYNIKDGKAWTHIKRETDYPAARGEV